MDNIEPKSDDSGPNIIDPDVNDSPSVNDSIDKFPQSKRKKKFTKLNFNVINKLLSSIKTKKSGAKSKKKKPTTNPWMATITPSHYKNFQTWNIDAIPSPQSPSNSLPSTPISNQNISRNTPITISIYETPSIKSFNVEYKYAPYYYLGYGFYGNPYDKNGKQCQSKPIVTINKMINIYDKIAISFNKENNEIIIWRNGKQDNTQKEINIQNNKQYQFIIESLDKSYNIKIN